MAFAMKIFAECEKKNINWVDPDFGGNNQDEHGAESLYYEGI